MSGGRAHDPSLHRRGVYPLCQAVVDKIRFGHRLLMLGRIYKYPMSMYSLWSPTVTHFVVGQLTILHVDRDKASGIASQLLMVPFTLYIGKYQRNYIIN